MYMCTWYEQWSDRQLPNVYRYLNPSSAHYLHVYDYLYNKCYKTHTDPPKMIRSFCFFILRQGEIPSFLTRISVETENNEIKYSHQSFKENDSAFPATFTLN